MVQKADFSEEQLYLIAGVLGFDAEQTDYFLLLGQYDRSAHHKHKKYIRDKMKIIQRRKTKTSERHQTNSLTDDPDHVALYYSDIHLSQIHMYLSLAKFANNPSLIQQELNLKKESLDHYLSIL